MKHFLLLISILLITINLFAQTQTRDDAGLQGNQGATSGFFETSSPVNYPSGASSWWHLLDIRHSNDNNNYAMQFSGSFFDQDLYFRKTNHSAIQPWSKVILERNGRVNINKQAWFSYGNLSMDGYSWTDAALTTNSIEIVNNEGTINDKSPTLAFHRYGSGGPQFRLAADGSNILYLESSGANSARSPLPYGGGPDNYFSKLHVDGALSVKGMIRSSEIKVDTGPWPDYVFEDNYQLPDLKDTESFIKINKHLPEIPPAKEVSKNGILLGEMNMKLLKKVEELTLHLIAEHKEKEEMKKRIEALEEKLSVKN